MGLTGKLGSSVLHPTWYGHTVSVMMKGKGKGKVIPVCMQHATVNNATRFLNLDTKSR
jgi:hypothetical protein